MAVNLSDRLKRIRLTRPAGNVSLPKENSPLYNNNNISLEEKARLPLEALGWVSAGCMVMRRECGGGSITLPLPLPQTTEMVIPGMELPWNPEGLLFFDLETTGLSCGAGTAAFLAAFGRLRPVDEKKSAKSRTIYTIQITQYLLIDYPGEYDFINALLGEIGGGNIIVSYNGKSFDSQILKTRCLMNGLVPPEYRHADLLYPARRLWKSLLPSCSQGTIEIEILGLNRTGDIPGSMAPDIWFSFLKNGETSQLMEICEHNRRDIAGLAAIFSVMTHIAGDPVAAIQTVNFDFGLLAIRWHEMTRWRKNKTIPAEDETGLLLLRQAACMGYSRAELHYAKELMRTGQFDIGRKLLQKSASTETAAVFVRAAALRALAIDSERRLGNIGEALELCQQGLDILPASSLRRPEFERRLARLNRKFSLSTR